jgi:adhesin HecA-like repeat protein
MPSDRIGYGYGPYGDADWGVEGVSKTGSASIVATALFAAQGGLSEVGSAEVAALSGVSANAVKEVVGASSIEALSVLSDVSADRIIDAAATSVADSGTLYGYGNYGSGDFGVATVFAVRVRTAGGSADASASLTSAAERIHQSGAQVDGVASLAADSDTLVNGQAVVPSVAILDVAYIRIRNTDGTISATGDLDASGREKWEPLAETPETWTRID